MYNKKHYYINSRETYFSEHILLRKITLNTDNQATATYTID